MSWSDVLPAWMLLIPVDELEAGAINEKQFLERIEKEPSIPESVKENWRNKFGTVHRETPT